MKNGNNVYGIRKVCAKVAGMTVGGGDQPLI